MPVDAPTAAPYKTGMRFGVIGDIHGFWDERDTAFFNQAGYDMLLFVGDFARMTNAEPVARRLSDLTTPAWAIPGNHDGVTMAQLLAELKGRPLMRRIGAIGMTRRVQRMAQAMAPVQLGGYTQATLADDLGLIVARPHAMGGDRFYYRHYLKQRYGVRDFASSAARLRQLVDDAPRDLIFLAHNGPAGLGDTPDAPFGCDFAPEHGDFGDPDLREAIEYARASGHRVRAVLAGHMHHKSKHTGEWRQTHVDDGHTLYINCARVPRVEDNGMRRHHIALEISAGGARAETVFVDNDGRICSQTALASHD